MRKRKRDWPQRVYDYAVVGQDLPEEFWETRRQQQNAWQALASLHQSIRQTLQKAIEDKQPPEMLALMREIIWGYKERGEDEKKHHRLGIWKMRAEEISGELHWEYGDDLLDRFEASVTRAARDGRGQYPDPRRRSLSARLVHRFTGGGKAITDLATDRGWRCRIASLGLGARIVQFGVSRQNSIAATVHFHRLPSNEAIVKRVVFCGRHSALGWDWRFQLTVEEPPPIPNVATDRIAAIDLGWRKMGDYIRVGYLVDSTGQEIELRLPLPDASSAASKKRRRSKRRIPVSLRDYQELQSRMDALKDECKASLVNLATDRDEILLARIPFFSKTGIRGLIRLRRDLEAAGQTPEAQFVISSMMAEYEPLRRELTAYFQQLVRRRKWFYGNLIAWLRDRYDLVLLEDAFSVKEMTEAEDLDYGLKGGIRYERFAAIGELKAGIERAMPTKEVVRKDSTLKHATCDRLMSEQKRLMMRCDYCGTRLDRDRNAAINLITQTDGLSVQEWGLRNSREYRARQIIEIPESLKAVAFLVQP